MTKSPLVLLVLLSSSVASASVSYPPALRNALSLGPEPICTLCHSSLIGGDGTIVTGFGKAMEQLGAKGNDDVPSLYTALQRALDSDLNSDGDGMLDLLELQQGSDPNVADVPIPPEPPEPPVASGGADSGEGGGTGAPPVDPPSEAGEDSGPPPSTGGRSSSQGGGGKGGAPGIVLPELVIQDVPAAETGCALAPAPRRDSWPLAAGAIVAAFRLGLGRRRVRNSSSNDH